jgi:hypothetical protein
MCWYFYTKNDFFIETSDRVKVCWILSFKDSSKFLELTYDFFSIDDINNY